MQFITDLSCLTLLEDYESFISAWVVCFISYPIHSEQHVVNI